jgi:hypothetical protein
MPFAPSVAHLLNEFKRDRAKGILRLKGLPPLGRLAFARWIAAVANGEPCFVAFRSRGLQRDFRVCAKRK